MEEEQEVEVEVALWGVVVDEVDPIRMKTIQKG